MAADSHRKTLEVDEEPILVEIKALASVSLPAAHTSYALSQDTAGQDEYAPMRSEWS